MYLASILNKAGLFQALGNWPSATTRGSGEGKSVPLTETLFRATSVVIWLQTMKALEAQCLAEYEALADEVEEPAQEMRMFSATTFQLVNGFGPVLSSIRAIQNQILPLVGSALGVSTPPSMNVKTAGRKKVRLPKSVTEKIWNYWDSHGAKVKAYRDIDQHYTASMARMSIRTDEPRRMIVLLPDNPEVKSPQQFTYDTETQALEYFASALRNLDTLLEGIAVELNIAPAPIPQRFFFEPPLKFEDGSQSALAVLVEDTASKRAMIFGQAPDRRVWVRKTR